MDFVSVAADERADALVAQLMGVWRSSVEATHSFLSPEEVDAIAAYVPEALVAVPELTVVYEDALPVAFMGIDGTSLEMLFVAASRRRRGIGSALVRLALSAGVVRVDVNEQNPQAVGFYEHMGFSVVSRSETDAQGMPYPILHMESRESAVLRGAPECRLSGPAEE